ncbi:hypothetical protein [Alkalihalobacterium chitinilyticum]|uniref:ATP-binding protein n=1 Tax=Alkalihalobacterium chitinilyticum TaxID=2980103 RepID=A0ABT5VFS5_9BACI|nr:hypothetical protein [Alkalihalobacterium chitinilyticum]MDE5414182.1 hypothetical protein [Alkalihalobacterium chitinilyticum]
MVRNEKNSFKTSVNIKFDLGKKEFFKRYLPTPSHAESLSGLLRGFNHEENRQAHIIIGPYGTGKSLIGTIVSSIISKSIDGESLELLKQKFNNVDDEIYTELTEIKNSKRYLPVVLNGNEGRFRHAIISAIMKTLKENNIQIQVPGLVNKILSTIQLWEDEFPKTYKLFLQKLKEDKKDIQIFRIEIMGKNEKEIEWFTKTFPALTSGAEFIVDFNDDFVEQVKYVLHELEKENLGLFIVYDEFGRLLQGMEVNEVHETMQDLQDIAELADHYSNALHILLITHRSLRQYFLRFTEEYQNEFQRIEKRYQIYHIDSDRSTFIRLTESALKQLKKKHGIKNDTNIEDIKVSLRKFPLFAELNQVENEKLVIKGAYPIHPVTLYLLPYLSNLFAQNERTLFTFLESQDTGGLINHIQKTNDYYLPHQLFNFFFPSLSELELTSDMELPLKTYRSLLSKIPELNTTTDDNETLQIKIVKLITLWSVSRLQSRFKLTVEFLAFALMSNETAVNQALQQLSDKKAVRFNRVLGYWELFEGSSLNVDEMIDENNHVQNVSRNKKLSVLDQAMTKQFYLANEYNDIKSMTRFATINLVYSSDILNDEFNSFEFRKEKNVDAVVNFIVLEATKDYDYLVKKLEKTDDPLSFFCLPKVPFDLIDKKVREYVILENLLSDQEILKLDKNLKDELLLRKEDIFFAIKEFVAMYEDFSAELLWLVSGEKIDVKNEIILEKKLSELMFQVFPLTPEIRNDSFNRRKVNNVQLKAGYSVVNQILQSYSEPNIGIEGQGPDYLIYATVFKNNKLDLNKLDQIKTKEFNELRDKLVKKIEKSSSGPLSDVINIMKETPFGIREPLVPILLVSLLRDYWDNIMFYRNNMFISTIDGEVLYRIVEEADNYQYEYFKLEKKYDDFITNSLQLIPKIQEDINKPKALLITSRLLTWLRSQPKYTQISYQMSKEAINLKEIVKQGEINPKLAVEQLFNLYGQNTDLFLSHIEELNSFINLRKIELENYVFEVTNSSSYSHLRDWALGQDVFNQKNNKLVHTIIQSSHDTWVDELSYNLVGVEIGNWSDTTNEMFIKILINEYQSLGSDLSSNEDYIEVSVNGQAKTINKVEMSTKTQTIYNNVQRMIKNGGRTVPKEEIEYMVLKLIEEFVD